MYGQPSRYDRWRYGGEPYVERRAYALRGIVLATTPRTVTINTYKRPLWFAADCEGPRPHVGDMALVEVGKDGDIHKITVEERTR